MFFLWVMINRIATNKENISKVSLWFFKTTFKKKGKLRPAIIDDNDTKRVANKTIKKTVNTNKLVKGVIHITIPKIVATPFPPLKPANTGNTWPTSAAIPKPNCKLTKSLLK